MNDIILGMGEVGSTLFNLLTERGIKCIGIDVDPARCRNWSGTHVNEPEYLHICIPGDMAGFEKTIRSRMRGMDGLKAVIIHSTVRPGTTANMQKMFKIPILFAPARGVHRRFLEDMKRYTKFFSMDGPVPEYLKVDMELRFKKTTWMSSTKTAELAKILVDTSYYGWLINYAQITKMICQKENVDFDEMWRFADEVQENLGNRPKMYPGIIGGHCIIPNLNLIEHEELTNINRINEMYRQFCKK